MGPINESADGGFRQYGYQLIWPRGSWESHPLWPQFRKNTDMLFHGPFSDLRPSYDELQKGPSGKFIKEHCREAHDLFRSFIEDFASNASRLKTDDETDLLILQEASRGLSVCANESDAPILDRALDKALSGGGAFVSLLMDARARATNQSRAVLYVEVVRDRCPSEACRSRLLSHIMLNMGAKSVNDDLFSLDDLRHAIPALRATLARESEPYLVEDIGHILGAATEPDICTLVGTSIGKHTEARGGPPMTMSALHGNCRYFCYGVGIVWQSLNDCDDKIARSKIVASPSIPGVAQESGK